MDNLPKSEKMKSNGQRRKVNRRKSVSNAPPNRRRGGKKNRSQSVVGKTVGGSEATKEESGIGDRRHSLPARNLPRAGVKNHSAIQKLFASNNDDSPKTEGQSPINEEMVAVHTPKFPSGGASKLVDSTALPTIKSARSLNKLVVMDDEPSSSNQLSPNQLSWTPAPISAKEREINNRALPNRRSSLASMPLATIPQQQPTTNNPKKAPFLAPLSTSFDSTKSGLLPVPSIKLSRLVPSELQESANLVSMAPSSVLPSGQNQGALGSVPSSDGKIKDEFSRMKTASIAELISPEQEAQLKLAFDQCDVDKDGLVSMEEFSQYLGGGNSLADLQYIFEDLNLGSPAVATGGRRREEGRGGTGEAGGGAEGAGGAGGRIVTYPEFKRALVRHMKPHLDEDWVTEAFLYLDRNGDDALSAAELRRGLQEREIAVLLGQADTNGDGEVDFGEFQAMMDAYRDRASPVPLLI